MEAPNRAPGVRVLVVEPDRALASVLCEELRAHGHEVVPAESLERGLHALAEAPFEVALVDQILPDGDGLELRRRAEAHGLSLEVLTVADAAAAPAAFDGLWRGAYDCLLKPTRVDELLALVAKAAEHGRLRRDAVHRAAVEDADRDADPIAVEPAMRAAVAGIERVAGSDVPLLLLGECGSGKTHLARFAHRRSPRAEQRFVAAYCAPTDPALEARLFGGGNGGGNPRGPAWLPTAEKGTLFVASVAEATPPVQEKLAEALASGRYRPAGADRPRRCDVRLLFGSRRDLRDAAQAGAVHGALRERLSDGAITIPPLRLRTADIEPLADHFLRRVAPERRLSAEAHAELARYRWPGNVRELKLVIERAALLGDGETVGPHELCLGSNGNGWPKAAVRAHLSLAALEMQYILATLEQNAGHRGRAARALGIDPKTLYNKLGPQRARRR